MPQLTSKQKAGGVAAICIAAAAVCLPLTKSSEGSKLKPYRDPANIVTWCYGETQGPHKAVYTEAECAQLLQNRLAARYAPMIVACVPEVADERHIKVVAALLDASYNAGTKAVCSSPMAARIRIGDVPGSCIAYTAHYNVEGLVTPGWFTTARYRGKPQPASVMRRHGWTWTGRSWRKVLPGLVTRRVREAHLCLEGAA